MTFDYLRGADPAEDNPVQGTVGEVRQAADPDPICHRCLLGSLLSYHVPDGISGVGRQRRHHQMASTRVGAV